MIFFPKDKQDRLYEIENILKAEGMKIHGPWNSFIGSESKQQVYGSLLVPLDFPLNCFIIWEWDLNVKNFELKF